MRFEFRYTLLTFIIGVVIKLMVKLDEKTVVKSGIYR